jgi:hypothetical protein
VQKYEKNITEEEIQMANKPVNTCSTSSITKELQSRTIMRYDATLLRIIKERTIRALSASEDEE